MPKGNTNRNDFVKWEANAVAMPSHGSTLYFHAHTASPGLAGTSSTNECAYTDYARVAVSRDGAGLAICDDDGTPNASGRAYKNVAEVTFPECNPTHVGSETIVAVSICTSGGQILRYVILDVAEQVVVNANDTPRIPAGACIFSES